MTMSILFNSLSGLLILTSLLVIEVKQARWSAIMYASQSLVLVLIFLALAYTMRRRAALLVGGQCIDHKGGPGAVFLYRAMPRGSRDAPQRPWSGALIPMAAFAVAVSFLVVNQIKLKEAAPVQTCPGCLDGSFFLWGAVHYDPTQSL